MTRILDAHETPEVVQDDAGYAMPEKPHKSTFEVKVRSAGSSGLQAVRNAPRAVWMTLGGISGGLVVVWLVFFFFLNTHPVKVSAESFSWERKTEIEKYMKLSEGDWDHPGDAYNISTSWRIHHYRQVYSHTTRHSCGTADRPQTCSTDHYRSEPVYATWYDYNIDRWKTERWLISAGTDKKPYWAVLPSTLNQAEVLGNEKEGNSHPEKYVVHTDKGYNIKVPLNKYLLLQVGSTGTANVNRQNDVRSVNWDIDR